MLSKKFNNAISLFLLVVFLLPSVVKLEHHHEHSEEYNILGKTQYCKFHEKCVICNFEFSVFSSEIKYFRLEEIPSFALHYSVLLPVIYYQPVEYTFLLRAPPFVAGLV